VNAAVETIALAFQNDPVWAVALGRDDGDADRVHPYWVHPYWQLYVEGALRHGTVFISAPGAGRQAPSPETKIDGAPNTILVHAEVVAIVREQQEWARRYFADTMLARPGSICSWRR